MSNIRIVILLLVLLQLGSCSAVYAPKSSVPKRTEINTDTFGGWISIEHMTQTYEVVGELIAVGADSIYVIDSDVLIPISKSKVKSARVIFYNTETQDFAAATGLASTLTLTNGYFLIITLPISLAIGGAITSAESKRINYVDYPQHDWAHISKYARFPQGLPDGMVLSDLKSRPN